MKRRAVPPNATATTGPRKVKPVPPKTTAIAGPRKAAGKFTLDRFKKKVKK